MHCKNPLWIVALVALALPAPLFAQVTSDRVEAARVEPPQRPWKQADKGALYVRSQGGAWQKAPTVPISFQVAITGLIARTTVTHKLHNPSDSTVEAIYVYPLPAGAMVDGLRIEAGGRQIVGEIQEKRKAIETYQRAKARGQRSGLVEQERARPRSTRPDCPISTSASPSWPRRACPGVRTAWSSAANWRVRTGS